MCFSSPKLPDPPPPPQMPPPEDAAPGEVEIGREAMTSRRGKRRKVRGRQVLTVGLNLPAAMPNVMARFPAAPIS